MANIHLFLMKDKTIVLGSVEEKFEEEYIVKRPIMVQPVQEGKTIGLASAPFPLPLSDLFLIKTPDIVGINKSEIRFAYSEEQLKKQIIDWYFSETSEAGIELATEVPNSNKGGLHLIK